MVSIEQSSFLAAVLIFASSRRLGSAVFCGLLATSATLHPVAAGGIWSKRVESRKLRDGPADRLDHVIDL